MFQGKKDSYPLHNMRSKCHEIKKTTKIPQNSCELGKGPNEYTNKMSKN